MLAKFKNIYNYGKLLPEYRNNDICHNLAKTLLDFGIEEVKICNLPKAGYNDLDHMNLWFNNFSCSPNIKVIYKEEEENLLWAICKSLNIRYSGGVGKNDCQIGVASLHGASYIVNYLTPQELFTKTYCYFYEMKKLMRNKNESN